MDTTKGTTFYSIRNLADTVVEPLGKPWEYDSSSCPWGVDKDTYKDWMKIGSTEHCLYSAVEPQYPVMRTGKSNEACYIHAFVADYDGIPPADPLALVEKQSTSATLPNYISKTFSDQIRLVWMFEHPIRVLGNAHAAGMLKFIGQKLHADKWFAKLDKKTYDPAQFWCVGKEWTPTSQAGRLIKGAALDSWAQEYFIANQKTLVNTDTTIPFADIEQEAVNRGFQRVTHFEPGRHCRRFWDQASDNDNGCLITDWGVCVFVPHDKPFMSWRDIFGPEFTSKYENRKFDKFFDAHYYNNATGDYWYLNEESDFVKRAKGSLVTHLRVLGCSAAVPKGSTCSPIDEKMLHIELHRSVDEVTEMVYFPVGVVRNSSRQKLLNISRVRTVAPSAPMVGDAKAPWHSKEVAQAFPFIHGLITHLFHKVPVPGARPGDPSQLDRFLWWLARFYRSGYYRRPASGHIMFIAGGTGQGKTMLASMIIPELMGGTNSNAEDFIMGKTRFSGDFAKEPVVTLNDCASANVKAAALIRDTLKRVAADGSLSVAVKFGIEKLMPWFGRFIVTLNTDHDSMMVLPELNISVRDKFIYLLATPEGAEKYGSFGTREENEARVRAELPAFARYLLDMTVPDYGDEHFDVRFGFKAWQHPVMAERCMTDETCEAVLDAMDMAFSSLPPKNKAGEKVYWKGTATQLYMCLAETGGERGNECFRGAVRSGNMRSFGKLLAKVSDLGYDIQKCGYDGAGSTKWKVYYGIITEAPPKVIRTPGFAPAEKEETDETGG